MQKLNTVLNEFEQLNQTTGSNPFLGSRYSRWEALSPVARRLSPERLLPNDAPNYVKSPAAKLAMRNGSLDPNSTFFSTTFNRKLKMKDSFANVFPLYNHGEPTTFHDNKPHAVDIYRYSQINDEGKKTHTINRQYTHKKDFIKDYSESMIKVESMRRKFGGLHGR